jgi:hypothetical protein
MLLNLDLDGGTIMSEAFAGALAPALGRTAAYDAVKTTVQEALSQNRDLDSGIIRKETNEDGRTGCFHMGWGH